MITPPWKIESVVQAAAVIRLTIPRSAIQEQMGPAMREVMDAVAAQGVAPSGPLFSHHFRFDPEIFDFEVGVPVAAPFAASGRVVAGELPGGTIVRTVHEGDYEGLPAAWGEFKAWVTENGVSIGQDFWECYLTPPGQIPRTELNLPVLANGMV